jgi:hypothetical protein
MKTRIPSVIIVPRTPNFVTTTGGVTYQIGELTDADIRKLGKDMTAAMLANAKRQRAEKGAVR